jgi:hypothetical protein
MEKLPAVQEYIRKKVDVKKPQMYASKSIDKINLSLP